MTPWICGLGGKEVAIRIQKFLSNIFHRIATSFPPVIPQDPVILSPPAGGRRIPRIYFDILIEFKFNYFIFLIYYYSFLLVIFLKFS
jgi:hypothetical protein